MVDLVAAAAGVLRERVSIVSLRLASRGPAFVVEMSERCGESYATV